MVAGCDHQASMVPTSQKLPFGPLDAEETGEAVLIYVSRIAFTASLFSENAPFSVQIFQHTILFVQCVNNGYINSDYKNRENIVSGKIKMGL